MHTNTQLKQRFVEMPTDLLDPSLLVGERTGDEPARSETNILQWMSYLPEDCIKTMIEMGWDTST
jgi:hypothetical protein